MSNDRRDFLKSAAGVAAMGYERDDVYVCNVVKCRPPDNRTPC